MRADTHPAEDTRVARDLQDYPPPVRVIVDSRPVLSLIEGTEDSGLAACCTRNIEGRIVVMRRSFAETEGLYSLDGLQTVELESSKSFLKRRQMKEPISRGQPKIR